MSRGRRPAPDNYSEKCRLTIDHNAMARAIGVSPRAINKIVLGQRAITQVMSIRFGAFFRQTPEFWHGL